MVPLGIRGEASWLSTASERAVIGVALLMAVLIFITADAACWLLYDAGFHPFGIMLASNAIAAILAFGFIYHIVRTWHERRERVRRELRIIGDTNHHIRNALELIQLSAQTSQNKEVIAHITIAVDRIQWVLRELLGEQSFYAYGERENRKQANGEKEKV
jgi:hypothetical protein